MEIQELLLSIWIEIYRHASFSGESQNTAATRDVERLRILLDYIHRHYMEHLTLEDLAAQIHICRSECCRFFKKCMNESLFDYLLDYRIESWPSSPRAPGQYHFRSGTDRIFQSCLFF